MTCFGTPRSRKVIFVFMFLSLFFFLVGFGLGVEHEGEMTAMRIPELVAFVLSVIMYVLFLSFVQLVNPSCISNDKLISKNSTVLLSYILVADETEIDPAVYRSLQIGSLLSFYVFSISIGKSGVIITRCEFNTWKAHDTFHHCTASIVQFASAVVHIISLMAAVIDSFWLFPSSSSHSETHLQVMS